MKKEWIILTLIIALVGYTGFMFGGASIANQYDMRYREIKEQLDLLYQGICYK